MAVLQLNCLVAFQNIDHSLKIIIITFVYSHSLTTHNTLSRAFIMSF